MIIGCNQEEPAAPSAMDEFLIPHRASEIKIDGSLDEWKQHAWTDGAWNLDRVKDAPWYEPKRNRLVVDAGEDTTAIDLEATYYLSWDKNYLYFGAEVRDNHNDVMDTLHEPKRWYYKDAIALFMELPKDTVPEKFQDGDHAFCFVADASMPSYGAWWRHGSADTTYLEEPIPTGSVDYRIRMNPWDRIAADYTLEARIKLADLVGEQQWPPSAATTCGFMIVHCDPDGGEYGGHLLIHGKGDNDQSWETIKFVADE